MNHGEQDCCDDKVAHDAWSRYSIFIHVRLCAVQEVSQKNEEHQVREYSKLVTQNGNENGQYELQAVDHLHRALREARYPWNVTESCLSHEHVARHELDSCALVEVDADESHNTTQE